jgi:hypothetical protein
MALKTQVRAEREPSCCFPKVHVSATLLSVLGSQGLPDAPLCRSKTRTAGRKKKFWTCYGELVQEHLPQPNSNNNDRSAVAHASALARDPLFQLLDGVTVLPDGDIHATARDWETWKLFSRQLALQTGTRFVVRHQHTSKGRTTREYGCLHGGKASWLLRTARKQRLDFTRKSRAGVSHKVQCKARIVLHLDSSCAHACSIRKPASADDADSDSDRNSDGGGGNDEDEDDLQPAARPAMQDTTAAAPRAATAGGTPAPGPAATATTAQQRPMGAYGGEVHGVLQGDAEPQRNVITVQLRLQHTNHSPLSAVDNLSQPVVDEVRNYIAELTLSNPSGGAGIMASIHKFAKQLIADKGLEVPNTDTRFYPTEKQIQNIAAAAKRDARMDKVDQVAVAKLVQRSQQRQPDDNFFFRPSEHGSKFMLVSQTKQQQRLMRLYGSKIIGMDATYKTNKWGFPMFLLNVVTNHGKGFPVGIFFIEEETTEMIAEALSTVQAWTPTWQPEYVMVDKSDAEIGAVEAVFGEGTSVLLCDFHRLQAWHRWINNNEHGIPASQ